MFSYANRAPEELRVCLIDTDLFPLWREPGGENEAMPGINIELMNAVVAPLEIKIIWERQPFARCLHSLQLGIVDVLNVASYSQERTQFGIYPMNDGEIDVSRRFKYDTYYAFTRQDSFVSFDGNTFTNLNGGPVAVEIGASVISKLSTMGIPLVEHPRVEYAFKMLHRGRISAVVTNQYNGLKYMNNEVKRLIPPVQEKPYYLVFSYQYYEAFPDTVERIWFISGQLQNHRYQTILQKYASLPKWPVTAQ